VALVRVPFHFINLLPNRYCTYLYYLLVKGWCRVGDQLFEDCCRSTPEIPARRVRKEKGVGAGGGWVCLKTRWGRRCPRGPDTHRAHLITVSVPGVSLQTRTLAALSLHCCKSLSPLSLSFPLSLSPSLPLSPFVHFLRQSASVFGVRCNQHESTSTNTSVVLEVAR
jgi:hypothetical protein